MFTNYPKSRNMIISLMFINTIIDIIVLILNYNSIYRNIELGEIPYKSIALIYISISIIFMKKINSRDTFLSLLTLLFIINIIECVIYIDMNVIIYIIFNGKLFYKCIILFIYLIFIVNNRNENIFGV